MSRTQNSKKRSLRMESLETRNLMAGNVIVDLFPSGIYRGDARITGDQLGNAVKVSEIEPGTFRVSGMFSNGSMTTVNGKAFVDIHTNNDDLWIDMKGGADTLLLGNATGKTTVEDLGINMGSGADTIFMENIEVYERSQPCNIDMGSESENDVDAINISNSQFKGALNVSTGGGADRVGFDNVQGAKRMTVNTGSGTDKVGISNSSADEIFAALGAGNSDELTVKGTRTRKLSADGGQGAGDTLRLLTGNSIGSQTKNGIETTKYI